MIGLMRRLCNFACRWSSLKVYLWPHFSVAPDYVPQYDMRWCCAQILCPLLIPCETARARPSCLTSEPALPMIQCLLAEQSVVWNMWGNTAHICTSKTDLHVIIVKACKWAPSTIKGVHKAETYPTTTEESKRADSTQSTSRLDNLHPGCDHASSQIPLQLEV